MKTKIKLLCPAEVWQPKRGGRPGNCNARKTGVHSARMRDLRSRIHAFKAYAREAMARAETLVRERAEALEQVTFKSAQQTQCHGPQKRATQMTSCEVRQVSR